MIGAPDLSIVVPCYNEEERLPRTIEQIERYLEGKGLSYELILVDDGSTDGTRMVMDAAAERNPLVRLEALPQNRGKGRALAERVAASRGSEILVTDADLFHSNRRARQAAGRAAQRRRRGDRVTRYEGVTR